MKFFPTRLSRRALVQNAGIVAGAGLLGLGAGAAVEDRSPRGKPARWRSSATAITTPITSA